MRAQEVRNARQLGGKLSCYLIKEGICDSLKRSGYTEDIDKENMCGSKNEAVAGIFQQLDKTICAQCDKRIFRECQSLVDNDGKNLD